MLAFNGPAYQHLRAAEFSEQQARACQGCLRILSGLYGLLKPLDLVKPYRYGCTVGGIIFRLGLVISNSTLELG